MTAAKLNSTDLLSNLQYDPVQSPGLSVYTIVPANFTNFDEKLQQLVARDRHFWAMMFIFWPISAAPLELRLHRLEGHHLSIEFSITH